MIHPNPADKNTVLATKRFQCLHRQQKDKTPVLNIRVSLPAELIVVQIMTIHRGNTHSIDAATQYPRTSFPPSTVTRTYAGYPLPGCLKASLPCPWCCVHTFNHVLSSTSAGSGSSYVFTSCLHNVLSTSRSMKTQFPHLYKSNKLIVVRAFGTFSSLHMSSYRATTSTVSCLL